MTVPRVIFAGCSEKAVWIFFFFFFVQIALEFFVNLNTRLWKLKTVVTTVRY